MKVEFILFLVLSFLCSLVSVSAKSALPPIVSIASKMENKNLAVPTASPPVIVKENGLQIPKAVKLLIGAGGIYSAFLYYGTLQEDVFHYAAVNGDKFKAAWLLQALGMSCLPPPASSVFSFFFFF